MKTKDNSTIIDLMQKFCGDSLEDARKWMSKPFYMDGTLHSTDASMVISVPECTCDDTSACPEKPMTYLRSIMDVDCHEQGLSFSKQQLDALVAGLPHHDEYKIVGICAECNGNGEVEWEFGGKAQSYTSEFECPACDGKGDYQRPTSRKTLSDHARIRIGTSVFDAQRVALLSDVCEIFGETIEVLKQDMAKNAIWLRVGGASVLLLGMEGAESDIEIILSPNS